MLSILSSLPVNIILSHLKKTYPSVLLSVCKDWHECLSSIYPNNPPLFGKLYSFSIYHQCSLGSLPLVQIICESNRVRNNKMAQVTVWCGVLASKKIEVVKWLCSYFLPPDFKDIEFYKGVVCSQDTIIYWMITEYENVLDRWNFLSAAVAKRKRDLVFHLISIWLIKQNFNEDVDEEGIDKCIFAAIRYGEIDVISSFFYRHQNSKERWKSGSKLMNLAAEYGKKHVLKWGMCHGFLLTTSTSLCAAKSGKLKILKWLHQKGWCSIGKDSLLEVAVQKGDIRMVDWCVNVLKCSISQNVFKFALYSRNFKTMGMLVDYGFQWDFRASQVAFGEAMDCKDKDFLKWFLKYRYHSPLMMEAVAICGDVEVMHGAVEQGYKYNVFTLKRAIRCDNLPIIQWLHDHGVR